MNDESQGSVTYVDHTSSYSKVFSQDGRSHV